MALTPYYTLKTTPASQTTGGKVAQTALSRWLERQRESRTQFTAAEQPLQQAVQMFQPGGGYGRGQETLLRGEARRAGAEATAQQVASGMASGSLATGTGLRIKRDLATSLAGVQDVRTQFLTQALQALSGMRGTQAQTTAATADPTLAPHLGYLSNIAAIQEQARGRVMGANVGLQMQSAQIQAQQKAAQAARDAAQTKAPTQKFAVPAY